MNLPKTYLQWPFWDRIYCFGEEFTTLTSLIIKVFERVVQKALIRHLTENSLMVDGQHGFPALRSTLTQLLGHIDAILEALESGATGLDAIYVVIYLNFNKAFEKVDHGVLFHKLEYKLWHVMR